MTLEREQLLTLYANLVRARKLDETMVKGIAEGKMVSFFHSGQGEEAVGVGGCTALRPDDYLYYQHRGHGGAHILSKGGSAKRFIAEHYGKATGACGGLGAHHYIDPDLGMLGMAATIGSAFPITLGWGVAAKKNSRGQVVACFFGDGAAGRGTMHEAMNLASVWKLPIVYVCHNNLYAQYMPLKDAFPREHISDLAAGYAMPGVVIDGQDVVAVHEAVQLAVARARAGEGPSLVECMTYRYRAHSEGVPDVSHAQPRPAEEIEAWKKRDPLILMRDQLLEQEVLSEEESEEIIRAATREIEDAERFALDSPMPEPGVFEHALYAR
jgi:acetoin:2,6-dichlorophenolindophenol oxidoreductase subunit alpha